MREYPYNHNHSRKETHIKDVNLFFLLIRYTLLSYIKSEKIINQIFNCLIVEHANLQAFLLALGGRKNVYSLISLKMNKIVIYRIFIASMANLKFTLITSAMLLYSRGLPNITLIEF